MNAMKHTRTLAKICSLIPFAVYGILGLSFLLFQLEFREDFWTVVFLFTLVFGWIPSLAGAVAGVVFSLFERKERHGKLFLICSCVNVAIGVAWGGAFRCSMCRSSDKMKKSRGNK